MKTPPEQKSVVRRTRVWLRAPCFVLLALLAVAVLPAISKAQMAVTYGFSPNTTVTDNGQIVDTRTLGGFATYTDANVSLNLTSANINDPMWLGDMYSTLTIGTATETERVAVLLNRPGRDNTDAFGSSLSSLNVTLDEAGSTNIWSTTSSTGTYKSDGRLGVDPYAAGVAFNTNDRTATLDALNGNSLASNKFSLLLADTQQGGTGTLSSWGMTVGGTAAGSGTMDAGGGTMSIADTGSGATNNIGATIVTTQAGGGPLSVNVAGTMTFSGGVSGTSGLTKLGNGTLTINSAGSFTGATIVSAGTLGAAATNALGSTSAITVNNGGTLAISGSGNLNRINDSAGITLAGGTLARSGSGTVSEGIGATNTGGTITGTSTVGLGALTLTATSNLDFGAGGVGTLVFSSFTANGNILNILNYTSTANTLTPTSGVDGTDDRLIFNQDQSSNLGSFNFGGGFTAMEIALDSGFWEITGVAAVPEPSTWLAGALALSALVYAQRRRLFSRRGAQPLQARSSALLAKFKSPSLNN